MGPKKAQSFKCPRLDLDKKRLSRFYEPLILLHVLDPNGEHRIVPDPLQDVDISSMCRTDLRRLFLRQLAYVCDNVPGGDKVTSMLLEQQPSGVVLRVTANTPVTKRTNDFLEDVMASVRSIASCQSESLDNDVEVNLGKACIEFNHKRLNQYARRMEIQIERCLAFLEGSEAEADISLSRFLQSLDSFHDDIPALCAFAYENRSCHEMKTLRAHAGSEQSSMVPGLSRREAFVLARHYIGRLGSHLRAAKVMTVAGRRMPELFDNIVIRRLRVPSSPCLPPPMDGLTTLPSMLKRMLPNGDKRLPSYQDALEQMDAKFEIMRRFRTLYQDEKFKPRVHAELNLLEWAYAENITFVDDDRYIACSKPACFCCYHYIKQHPGGFVVPPSHSKRYIAWRPPDVKNPEDTTGAKHWLDMLNAVTTQIRQDTFRNIESRKGPSGWRPDSTTGITVSCRSPQFGPVRDGLEEPLLLIDSKPHLVQSASVISENDDYLHADTDAEKTPPVVIRADVDDLQQRQRDQSWSDDDSDLEGGVLLSELSI